MIMLHPLSTGYHHLLRMLSCSDIPTCMEYLLPDFVLCSRGLWKYHVAKILQKAKRNNMEKPKLLDEVHSVMRLKHYSLRTEDAYHFAMIIFFVSEPRFVVSL